jgi:hypothetical protein
MRRPAELVFVVHVAAAPVHLPATADAGAQLAQRCLACGFVLVDNTGWLTEGGVLVPDGQTGGPSWFPIGDLVGTDKTAEKPSGMTYVKPEGRPLDANERPCS